jgi:hypothetical protein
VHAPLRPQERDEATPTGAVAPSPQQQQQQQQQQPALDKTESPASPFQQQQQQLQHTDALKSKKKLTSKKPRVLASVAPAVQEAPDAASTASVVRKLDLSAFGGRDNAFGGRISTKNLLVVKSRPASSSSPPSLLAPAAAATASKPAAVVSSSSSSSSVRTSKVAAPLNARHSSSSSISSSSSSGAPKASGLSSMAMKGVFRSGLNTKINRAIKVKVGMPSKLAHSSSAPAAAAPAQHTQRLPARSMDANEQARGLSALLSPLKSKSKPTTHTTGASSTVQELINKHRREAKSREAQHPHPQQQQQHVQRPASSQAPRERERERVTAQARPQTSEASATSAAASRPKQERKQKPAEQKKRKYGLGGSTLPANHKKLKVFNHASGSSSVHARTHTHTHASSNGSGSGNATSTAAASRLAQNRMHALKPAAVNKAQKKATMAADRVLSDKHTHTHGSSSSSSSSSSSYSSSPAEAIKRSALAEKLAAKQQQQQLKPGARSNVPAMAVVTTHTASSSSSARATPASSSSSSSSSSSLSASANLMGPPAAVAVNPIHRVIPYQQNKDSNNYIMSDHEDDESDYSSDEEEGQPKKFIPTWAREPLLSRQVQAQQMIDPDTIFPAFGGTCDLGRIFKDFRRKRRFNNRTSSGNWFVDRLRVAEELKYNQAMGFRK